VFLLRLLCKSTDSRSGAMLNCNIHKYPQRCHQLKDHSKMECEAILASKCLKGHKVTRRCHDKAAAICKKCEAELRAQEKRQKRDYKLDQERQAKQQAYAAKLAEIEDEISHQKRLIKDQYEEQARQNVLAQRKQDLLTLKEKGAGAPKASVEPPSTLHRPMSPQNSEESQPQATTQSVLAASLDTSDPNLDDGAPAQSDANPDRNESEARDDGAPAQSDVQPDWDESEARDDWLEQKELWGAESEALDSLMSMIGKSEF
jgi:hypothetical protein